MAVQTILVSVQTLSEPAMPKETAVRKNLRLSQSKIDRARRILGTRTETETIEEALDLVVFRQEVVEGLQKISGTGILRDPDELG
jgi:hypothetical protein